MDTKTAALILVLASIGAGGAEKRTADQVSLKEYGKLVGEWRGTGQLQRGSARGAWTEKAEWSWKLTNDSAALSFNSPNGKHLRTALLRPAPPPRSLHSMRLCQMVPNDDLRAKWVSETN